MNRQDVLKWLHNEFNPLILATPDDTILQIIDNAVRYLNTFSAFRILYANANFLGGSVVLPNSIKTVVTCYPFTQGLSILTNYPTFSLLGIAVLDNCTSDLILMGESFKAYKYYLSSDFRYVSEPSPDQTISGPTIYSANYPVNNSGITVVGTKYFFLDDTEEITEFQALQFVLYYSKALLKMSEGNLLRKSDLIGVHNDGAELIREGKEEKKELEETLASYGRWCAFVRRI